MEGLQSCLDYTSDTSASKQPTRRTESGVVVNPTQTFDQFSRFYVHPQQRQETREPNTDPDRDPDPHQFGATSGTPNSNRPPTPLPRQETDDVSPVGWQYRECLKNHAASTGGHVVDGCGEFMPSGAQGTPDALKCAACECHRNFHRKETEGGQLATTNVYYSHNPNGINYMRATNHHNPAPHPHRAFTNHYSPSLASPSGPVMMAFGGRATAESSSEGLNMFQSTGEGQHMVVPPSYSRSKKRFRTKFTKEHKDRMHKVAEKMGWKIQKQNDEEVQQLCQDLGVKRQVFKVWMHNNKQAMKKTQQDQ